MNEKMRSTSKSPCKSSQLARKKMRENIGDGQKLQTKSSSTQKLHKKKFEKDVVYLFQFTRTPLLPSLSCYCLKVETWLRLNSVKYENIDHKMKYRSNKGQLPFIELNGEHIADSDVIIQELSLRFGCDLDSTLTAEQKGIAHAATSMLDNHLAWVVMWWRAKHPSKVLKGYKVNLQHALGTRIPKSILNFFFKSSFRRKGRKKVRVQGIGTHSPEEITLLGQNDLKVLVNLLATKLYFFGNDPTNLDVAVFAHLAQIYFIDDEVSYPLRDHLVTACPNLVGLIHRMKEKCFPDWEKICNTLELNTHLAQISV